MTDPHLDAVAVYAESLTRQGWDPIPALQAAARALPRPTPPPSVVHGYLLADGTAHPIWRTR